MKLLLLQWRISSSCSSNSRGDYYSCIHGLFRVLLYSTRIQASSAPKEDILFIRLLRESNPKASAVPILDKWMNEGRDVEQNELQKIIKQFRKYRRFKHALEISEWMRDQNYLDPSPGDIAVELDLISKVRGLEQAENYFNNLPSSLRVYQVYGALLNSYADAKLLHKAEVIMQKMREFGYNRTLSYNVMLKLYSQTGNHEKVDSLVEEMEERGIKFDKITYNIMLNYFATNSDIEGMEKSLRTLESDGFVFIDWNAYSVAANGYLKAGDTEKALAALKKCEQLIRVKSRRFAYDVVLTLYASMGRKDEVYRIWNLHKKMGTSRNVSYLCMISSLAKLDDLDGAEKIYEEWETESENFDFRVPNAIVTGYCVKGQLENAESFIKRVVESGREPNCGTWSRMALGYCKCDRMEEAVGAMKKAIGARNEGGKPHLRTLVLCVEYLKGKGDVEMAEMIGLLEENGHFPREICEGLVKHINGENVEGLIGFDRNLEGEVVDGIAQITSI